MLNSKFDEYKDKISSLEKKLKELSDDLATLKDKVKDNISAKASFDKLNNDIIKQITNLKSQINTPKNDYLDQLKKIESECTSKDEKHPGIETRINKLKIELKSTKELKEQLELLMPDVKTLIEDRKNDFDKIQQLLTNELNIYINDLFNNDKIEWQNTFKSIYLAYSQIIANIDLNNPTPNSVNQLLEMRDKFKINGTIDNQLTEWYSKIYSSHTNYHQIKQATDQINDLLKESKDTWVTDKTLAQATVWTNGINFENEKAKITQDIETAENKAKTLLAKAPHKISIEACNNIISEIKNERDKREHYEFLAPHGAAFSNKCLQ